MVSPKVEAGILDANGIIGLAKAGCFSLTQNVFAEVFVPSLVVSEITDPLSKRELEQALGSWLKEETPTLSSQEQVPPLKSEADRQVIGLALDHRPCVIVTGDLGLSKKAKRLQITTISEKHHESWGFSLKSTSSGQQSRI
jgi:predicted nucleic acid-binding protein